MRTLSALVFCVLVVAFVAAHPHNNAKRGMEMKMPDHVKRAMELHSQMKERSNANAAKRGYAINKDKMDEAKRGYAINKDKMDEAKRGYAINKDKMDEAKRGYAINKDRMDEAKRGYAINKDKMDEAKRGYAINKDNIHEAVKRGYAIKPNVHDAVKRGSVINKVNISQLKERNEKREDECSAVENIWNGSEIVQVSEDDSKDDIADVASMLFFFLTLDACLDDNGNWDDENCSDDILLCNVLYFSEEVVVESDKAGVDGADEEMFWDVVYTIYYFFISFDMMLDYIETLRR